MREIFLMKAVLGWALMTLLFTIGLQVWGVYSIVPAIPWYYLLLGYLAIGFSFEVGQSAWKNVEFFFKGTDKESK